MGRDFGGVQVDDFPATCSPLEDDGAPVEDVRSIVKVEGSDGDVASDLNPEINGLQVHVRTLGSSRSNFLEYFSEILLKFNASVGSMRKLARVEDSRIVCEKSSKLLPVEVIEG